MTQPLPPELSKRVLRIVASALDRDPADVQLHSSLIDDLGAESIDFLDIRFQVETEFQIKVSDEELWEGQLHRAPGAGSQESYDEALRRLKHRLPDFRWERFPGSISQADLPRLITPATIVDFLQRRGAGGV